MRANIYGCGPTVTNDIFNQNPDICIGVNDAAQYLNFLSRIDYLVVLDPPNKLEPERIIEILNWKYKGFFSPEDVWFKGDYWRKLTLNELIPSNCGNLKTLDDPYKIPFSTNSAFVATILAYHMGAKEIVLYGVDFTPDWVKANNFPLAKTIMHYDNLRHELEQRNVKLYVCSEESALYPTLPIYNKI